MSGPHGTLSLLASINIWVCNFYAPMFPCFLLYNEIKFSLNSLRAMLLQLVSLRKCEFISSLSALWKIQNFIPICNFWLSGKEPACQAGDVSLIPGLGRFPGGGNGKPFQYSCLENSMDKGIWWATAYGIAEHACIHTTLYKIGKKGPTMFKHSLSLRALLYFKLWAFTQGKIITA